MKLILMLVSVIKRSHGTINRTQRTRVLNVRIHMCARTILTDNFGINLHRGVLLLQLLIVAIVSRNQVFRRPKF